MALQTAQPPPGVSVAACRAAWKPQRGAVWPGVGDGPARPDADAAPAGQELKVLPTAQLEGLLGEYQRPSSGNAPIPEPRGRSRGPPPPCHPAQSLPRAGALSPTLAWGMNDRARLTPGPQCPDVQRAAGQWRSPAQREETGRPPSTPLAGRVQGSGERGAYWSSRPKGSHEGTGSAAPASEGCAPGLGPPRRGVEAA